MVTTKDKAGQTIYVTRINDCEYNKDGFYCETYADENCDSKIDDFCIHTDDCDCTNDAEVENYMRHYYDDMVLDLNYIF